MFKRLNYLLNVLDLIGPPYIYIYILLAHFTIKTADSQSSPPLYRKHPWLHPTGPFTIETWAPKLPNFFLLLLKTLFLDLIIIYIPFSLHHLSLKPHPLFSSFVPNLPRWVLHAPTLLSMASTTSSIKDSLSFTNPSSQITSCQFSFFPGSSLISNHFIPNWLF